MSPNWMAAASRMASPHKRAARMRRRVLMDRAPGPAADHRSADPTSGADGFDSRAAQGWRWASRSRISVRRTASSDGAGVSSAGTSPLARRALIACTGLTMAKNTTAATDTK